MRHGNHDAGIFRESRRLVAQIPAGANNAQITVIGSSFGLATTAANLELAKQRAIVLSDYLKDQGVTGHYVVSVSTSFDVKAQTTRSAHAAVQPNVNSDGQPISTVNIDYLSSSG